MEYYHTTNKNSIFIYYYLKIDVASKNNVEE